MHSALFCFPDFSIYVVENFVLLCKLASMKRYKMSSTSVYCYFFSSSNVVKCTCLSHSMLFTV
uniref:Putative ovule protein n=1 Tax=Solanum chacoense TaxID=4108 RepID=A0A0V0HLZ8_SOLCH